jgi:hypothetical protein
MGRMYSISFAGVSVSAAQDLFSYKAAAGKPFVLHEVTVMQEGTADMGDAQAEALRFSIKRATGAFTAGSAGSTPTPAPHNTSDTAAGGTTHVNDTTQAALTTVRAEPANVQSGWQYLPPPEQRLFFAAPSNPEACVVTVSAPADAISLSGTMVIEEMG